MFILGKGAISSYLRKGETKYEKLHGDGSGDSKYVHARDALVPVFHRDPRIRSVVCWAVARQH
jgi:hypothetical protein